MNMLVFRWSSAQRDNVFHLAYWENAYIQLCSVIGWQWEKRLIWPEIASWLSWPSDSGVANLSPLGFYITFERFGIWYNAFSFPFSYSIRIRSSIWGEYVSNSSPHIHGKPTTPGGCFRPLSIYQEWNEIAAKFQRRPSPFRPCPAHDSRFVVVRCRPKTGNSNGGQ